MSWLRSRWTVVALVPAFFLAGFGIVSALAGGSDQPGPAAASAGASTGGPAIVTVIGEAGPAATAGEEEEGAAGAADGPTEGGDGGSRGGGGGDAPPAPPPGEIRVDYGGWDGVFELASPGILHAGGFDSVTGELSYLGGVDCPVGLVRVRTWLYDDDGGVVGETVWKSVDSTGAGGEVTGREPLPFDAGMQVARDSSSAVLRFTVVQCL